uniref:Uncharacterized protein n=1 Tax=Brassica oleracea var. oleracea TaxID=109376 RepID=A0A0D3BKE4_BRAOL
MPSIYNYLRVLRVSERVSGRTRDVPQIELVELNQSDTLLDELNTQVSWTDTILDELSRTDTHLDKLSKQVRSSELVRPPEKLEMANLLSDEPTTNSIMPKVKMFEADQRRLFSQFEVQEFCDNLVEGAVKALKDVSKIQKKSTTTRAPVAKPSLFINEKPKGKSENNLEDVKDFLDSLPIFDEYDEELIESLMICEDNCDLPFPELDFMFNKEQTITELTFLQPEHPSSLVLFSQDFEEKKAPSITPIIMENNLCFDRGTTPTPFPINFQEHFKFLKHNQAVQIGYLRDASDKGSVQGEYLNIQKIFEGDSSPMKKRPEPKPIIGLKMDLPAFHKPNIRRNVH